MATANHESRPLSSAPCPRDVAAVCLPAEVCGSCLGLAHCDGDRDSSNSKRMHIGLFACLLVCLFVCLFVGWLACLDDQFNGLSEPV